MNAQPKASHFVDGAYLEDKAGAPIEVIYPATGEVIAVVHEATPAVVEAALASACRPSRSALMPSSSSSTSSALEGCGGSTA
jgi:acyl-CoA reductase-like NAD-dependent aldehyde dehydrogenase